jgi:hypothetical protein
MISFLQETLYNCLYLNILKYVNEPCMVVHTCNPRIEKDKAGGSGVQDQTELYSEFQASLGYTARPSKM